MNYTQPLFKFLEKKYADDMLTAGCVKVGTLHEYRDSEVYKGLIHDANEGRKSTVVDIGYFKGTANEVGQHLGFLGGPGQIIIHKSSFVLNQDSPNCLIYCTAATFFSDTLLASVEEGKTSCIMITDPCAFFEELSKHINNSEYIGIFNCIYGERERILKWDMDKEKIKSILEVPAAIIKPESHKNFREVRAIWNQRMGSIEPQIKEVAALKKYIIEVNFQKIDTRALKNRNNEIYGVDVTLKNGTASTFSINSPKEVFTPLIYEDGNEKMLGFVPQTQGIEFNRPTVKNSVIGIVISEVGPIFCVNRLNNIARLDYFTKEIPM